MTPAHSRLPVGQGRAALAPQGTGAGTTRGKGWLWVQSSSGKASFSLCGRKAALPSRPDKLPEIIFLTHTGMVFSLCVSANDGVRYGRTSFGLTQRPPCSLGAELLAPLVCRMLSMSQAGSAVWRSSLAPVPPGDVAVTGDESGGRLQTEEPLK